MAMSMHTPTPWKQEKDTLISDPNGVNIFGANGEKIVEAGNEGGCESDPYGDDYIAIAPEDAALIVRAVNSHAKLVEACREALLDFERVDNGYQPYQRTEHLLREALAAAGSRSATEEP